MGSFTRCSHSICITFPDSWAVERSGGTRTQGCAPRSGFSLREIARWQGHCQRRPSDPAARGERCEHMNEVTILAPNEVVEQLEASERLPQDIDPDALRKYFTLTRPDLEQVDQCRGATNKLGFTVQLCTLRWRDHFLREREKFQSRFWRPCPYNLVSYQSLSTIIRKTKKRDLIRESITSILNGCARPRVAQSKVLLNGGFRADVPNTRRLATLKRQ